MKKSFMMAAIVLFAATSCTNESVNEVVNNNAEQTTVPVRVRVSDFSISMEEFPATRAAVDPSTYSGVKAMTLAFYDAEGAEVSKTTRIKGDGSYTTFGEFTADLPVGHYTMVVIGRGHVEGDVFVLTSATQAGFTSDKLRETFTAAQTVTVTGTTPLDLEVTLNRIITRLNITSTDNVSSGVTKIRTTYAKGSKSFNPSTGLATDDAGYAMINSANTNNAGHLNISSFVFLATDEETMTITLEALDDDDQVLSTKVISNVPLKRNRQTTLSGAVFTADESEAAFQLETEWLEANTVDF